MVRGKSLFICVSVAGGSRLLTQTHEEIAPVPLLFGQDQLLFFSTIWKRVLFSRHTERLGKLVG